MDQLCRHYPLASPAAKAAIEKAVEGFKEDLRRLSGKNSHEGIRDSLYSQELCVPCLFNSGCAIGKRGITAIEIEGGTISLVQWRDERRADRGRISGNNGGACRRLDGTPFVRTVLKQEALAYIFSRIRLLA